MFDSQKKYTANKYNVV